MKQLAAQTKSEGAAVMATSPRAAILGLAAYPWLDGTGMGANCQHKTTDAIAFTSKHRLRRPPDSWH